MNIKPFLKSIFDSFMADLHSTDVDSFQKEIAEGFQTYFGLFKDGEIYILDNGRLSRLSPKELSEELPFSEEEIEEYLSYTRHISLCTHLSYNGIYIQPDNQWAIGGMYSILKDLLTGKVTFFTFPVKVEFDPSLGMSYSISVTLSRIEGEGIYIKAVPVEIQQENVDNSRKYSGYYASEDGSMDAQVVIDKFNLSWNRANVFKYIVRAGKKDPSKEIEDLEKAIQYLKFEISRIKG